MSSSFKGNPALEGGEDVMKTEISRVLNIQKY